MRALFAIADVFDALTSRRPYKEPCSLQESLRILREGSGTHFDPEVLDAFAGIADSIYADLSGREDVELEREREAVTRRHFAADRDCLS